MATNSRALDNHMKFIAASLIGGFGVAVLAWFVFLQDMLFTILREENFVARTLGLYAIAFFVLLAMGSVMFPILKSHMRKMDAEHNGYQPSYSLLSFLPSKLLGRSEVEQIRVDNQPLMLGMAIGGARAMRINRMHDRIHDQRENGVCEKCRAEWHDTYEVNGTNKFHPFVFVEKYEVWYLLIPIRKKHITTEAYCNQHIPAEHRDAVSNE